MLEGHRAGADTVRERLRDSVELGIEELTVYSFSTENWTRPQEEVEGLMAMLRERIDRETPELKEEGVRMRFIGRREGVGPELTERMDWAERETAENERITLFVAFNYGGRAEIMDAARGFHGGDEDDFRRGLYAPEMHDPDLLIRTSGEQRISNYLLWQCAYSELVFREDSGPTSVARLSRPRCEPTTSASGASEQGDGRPRSPVVSVRSPAPRPGTGGAAAA